jgi:hypothetical protein
MRSFFKEAQKIHFFLFCFLTFLDANEKILILVSDIFLSFLFFHFISYFRSNFFHSHYLFPMLGNSQNSIISRLLPEQDMKALFPFSCSRQKKSRFFNGSNYFSYLTPSILFPAAFFASAQSRVSI